MIDVPLLQGLKEYYDYVNLCNTWGIKPRSFEVEWKQDYKWVQDNFGVLDTKLNKE